MGFSNLPSVLDREGKRAGEAPFIQPVKRRDCCSIILPCCSVQMFMATEWRGVIVYARSSPSPPTKQLTLKISIVALT